jgi:hypothetical protein
MNFILDRLDHYGTPARGTGIKAKIKQELLAWCGTKKATISESTADTWINEEIPQFIRFRQQPQ